MASQLKLPDGRILDYYVAAQATDSYKPPVIWVHGTPGAYPVFPDILSACERKGLGLVTFSRSGYGGSSRRKGRRIVDEVDDVQSLMEHLGHQMALVCGWSGGGPVTLACAARLQGCVAALVIASVGPYGVDGLDFLAGMGQDNIDEFNATTKGEEALKEFCTREREGMLQVDGAGLTEFLSSILPPVDKRAMLEHDTLGNYTADAIKEGLKHGCDGWMDDDLSSVQPWGFDFGEIHCPISLYHGSEDKMVPYSHGKWLAEHIPKQHLTAHLVEGEGHLSIVLGRLDDMLDELLGAASLK
ncbi:hypothetical protein BAUCODRAFT_155383 [Baudoinia panamericana UAMH 10762]|uniref:AB hydrolase-1 domain-containing protein n=1 Tax=Baudoinia panamericana (strain UAMH 10762) TaxID=717646 RepID=M2LUC8_BAUPA|nr:uncharacterized protein BAUCODRAFT_155383 [Baudoinia panamericana UAMH 10762]EMC98172.1 hypothetical protein BAUCODRAFT_155383 [Baudoinia panamericana UAMH 10762]